ncbi:MAG: DUF86 domain-containing protein [Caldilineaceae bacterium]|nr:DUF86 domain-containing protein [Caldilineaceae bacterium]
MPKDDVALLDIARAANLIREFLNGMSQSEFSHDAKTQSSVLYQLLVVGEAVKRLTGEFRSRHDSIPWSLIAGMRDHLIHAYDTVDWEEVWSTVTSDIPELLAEIESLLPDGSETDTR